MDFMIEVTEIAGSDLGEIKPFYRNRVFGAMEQYLGHTPNQESRSRIKRLRLLNSPAYRLRVDDFLVFYDVDEPGATVTILRVLTKEASLAYLRELEAKN